MALDEIDTGRGDAAGEHATDIGPEESPIG
jgi:hypothetical protein